jgi:hypothetical protein
MPETEGGDHTCRGRLITRQQIHESCCSVSAGECLSHGFDPEGGIESVPVPHTMLVSAGDRDVAEEDLDDELLRASFGPYMALCRLNA